MIETYKRLPAALLISSAFIFLGSCRSSDTDNTLSVGAAVVSFNLAGTDYSEDNSSGTNPSASAERINTGISRSQSRSGLLTPSSLAVVEFVPSSLKLKTSQASSEISPVAAVGGNSLGSGNKFRVIAYRSNDGSYHTYQDYTIGQAGKSMMLDAGIAYNIIVYSYGTTSLPAISSGEQSNLSSAVVNYDNINRDFMYQNISYTPVYTGTGQTNTLSITLRHKTTQITPVITSTPIGISAISNASFTPHFSNGIIPLSSGNISGRTISSNQVVSFPGPFPAAAQTATTVLVNADTGGNSTGSFTADITVGGVTKTVTFSNAFKITPESRGNLNLNLIKCGAYIAPGVWKDFMCHNLGADTSANPFIPSAAIHGAKYQWGAQTGEVGRYVSQADDQANSGNITGWNGTSLPKGTWSDTSKTLQDPCPAGYRVPTAAEWQGVTQNNPIVRIGTTPWTANPTNYGNMIKAGNGLALPIPGARYYTSNTGYLQSRGQAGIYFSSSFSGSRPNTLRTSETLFDTSTTEPTFGLPIRCIADTTVQTDWNNVTNNSTIELQFNK
ncbi:hypothetical protein HZP25_15680 [Elizabethkingia anophelis]|nr:hypothetical protein [Elizabethkingia anophelis]